MKYVTPVLLLIAGLINFYPVIGVLSATQLEKLYGFGFENPDLIILMRHRAVLFGLLGGLILASIFKPSLRLLACIAGLVSMIVFILLAYASGEYGEALHKIVVADVIASVALIVVLALRQRIPTS